MKKMRSSVGIWWILIGITTSLGQPAYATPDDAPMTTPQLSGISESMAMANQVTDVQRRAMEALLDEVMAILRDGKALDPSNVVFGSLQSAKSMQMDSGATYTYVNKILPPSKITFIAESDPFNYAEDRTKVPVVPSYFSLEFKESVRGVDRVSMEKRLDLADYWIDSSGKKDTRTSFPKIPSTSLFHRYRYRAYAHADSRFPVDVELQFTDPPDDDPSGSPKLFAIIIHRAYPIVTPEDRKRMREEKEQRVRELYGNPGVAK